MAKKKEREKNRYLVPSFIELPSQCCNLGFFFVVNSYDHEDITSRFTSCIFLLLRVFFLHIMSIYAFSWEITGAWPLPNPFDDYHR